MRRQSRTWPMIAALVWLAVRAMAAEPDSVMVVLSNGGREYGKLVAYGDGRFSLRLLQNGQWKDAVIDQNQIAEIRFGQDLPGEPAAPVQAPLPAQLQSLQAARALFGDGWTKDDAAWELALKVVMGWAGRTHDEKPVLAVLRAASEGVRTPEAKTRTDLLTYAALLRAGKSDEARRFRAAQLASSLSDAESGALARIGDDQAALQAEADLARNVRALAEWRPAAAGNAETVEPGPVAKLNAEKEKYVEIAMGRLADALASGNAKTREEALILAMAVSSCIEGGTRRLVQELYPLRKARQGDAKAAGIIDVVIYGVLARGLEIDLATRYAREHLAENTDKDVEALYQLVRIKTTDMLARANLIFLQRGCTPLAPGAAALGPKPGTSESPSSKAPDGPEPGVKRPVKILDWYKKK